MQNERKCNDTSCNGDCSNCASASKHEPQDFIEKLNAHSSVKHVIGVVSGKGGVGKSMVTAMLAVLMSRKGYKVGILDADITGPSIPKMFGINSRAKMNDMGILPEETANGIKIMSCNLLLDSPDAPVVWRGPVLAGAVKQFWTDVYWGEIDYMFVDMPPGTGDVPLTVYQSLPIDGAVIVTSPQDLVSLIVKKACNMASMMNIPVLGMVENMSYVKCPDCGKEINIFGESHFEELCSEIQIMPMGKMPIDPKLTELCNAGEFERFAVPYLEPAASMIETALK
jgi:Mrp family chromosome partitioning ATPase